MKTFTVLASMSMVLAGCSVGQKRLNIQQDRLLLDDRASVDRTQQEYDESLLKSGPDSWQTQNALGVHERAHAKLASDSSRVRDYQTIIGQLPVARQ